MPRGTTVPEAAQQTEARAGTSPLALALALAPKPQICRTRGRLAGLGGQDANLKPQDRRVNGQAGGTGGRKLAGPAGLRPGWESGHLMGQPGPQPSWLLWTWAERQV